VELITPGDAGDFGFRAFDGAPLEASDAVPLHYNFQTGSQLRNAPPLEPPAPQTGDIDALLGVRERCGACHDADDLKVPQGQPMGFAANNLLGTAVDKVAHETAITGSWNPLKSPTRFGANMPIVELGEPSNSYLLYKLLLDPDNYGSLDCSKTELSATDCQGGKDNRWCVAQSSCTAGPELCAAEIACLVDPEGSCYRAALPGGSIAPSADELRRLRNWFGAGDPMPLPYEDDAGLHAVPLGKAELRMVQSWIANAKACGSAGAGGVAGQ
jgi:hypothetical protein